MTCMTATIAFIVESRTTTGESTIGEFDPSFSFFPTCPRFSSLCFFFLAAKSYKDIFFGSSIGSGGADSGMISSSSGGCTRPSSGSAQLKERKKMGAGQCIG
jgi:hypothetical protein